MEIFDVWLESWTMTDLIVFGTASLIVVLAVVMRAFLAGRVNRTSRTDIGSENGT